MSDTVEQPVLKEGGAAASLARIAGSLDLLASVLAAFPDKRPEIWRGGGFEKELNDLTLACEHLRQYARQIEDVVASLKR